MILPRSSHSPGLALFTSDAIAFSARRITSPARVPIRRQLVFINSLLPAGPTVAKGDLHMCKKSLRQESKVFEAEAVEEAAGWASALVSRTYRGPGDTVEAAMHRAENKFGVPVGTLWALRYRKPKAILAGIYLSLKAAYDAECERQEAKLAHELAITKALAPTPARLALIAESEALLGPGDDAAETGGK